jgi:hypothetical protein
MESGFEREGGGTGHGGVVSIGHGGVVKVELEGGEEWC